MICDDRGLSMIEYILGGALALALVGLAVFNIATSTSTQGNNVTTSINSMPAQPTW